MENKKVVIEGVGEEAEIVTNAAGGKQSKSPMAMHLLTPDYLSEVFKSLADEREYIDEGDSSYVDAEDIEKHNCYRAIEYISCYMRSGVEFELELAMNVLEGDKVQQVIKIAKVLQYGADRYPPNN